MDTIRVRLSAVVAVLFFVAACGGGGGSHGGGTGGAKYPTTSLQVAVGGPMQTASLGVRPLVFLGTFADVARVTVVVSGDDKFGVFRDPLTSVNLTLGGDGVWRGTIPDLAVGPTLTFTAGGYDAGDVLIFSGVATQALTGSADSVAITMTPQDDGTAIAFPIVNSIIVPAEFAANTSGAVSVGVTGSPSETLSYAFTSGGGGFVPASGTIPLPGSGTGTIGTTYTAPAALGTYTHAVRVTNSQGNAVETDFPTVVVTSVTTPGVQVLFAPTVTTLLGKRTGNNVSWTATVQDDKDIGLLTHAWSFTQTGGTEGSAFSTANANPGIQSAYDQTVTGTISLTVTDGDGLFTTLTFTLVPGQFPDSLMGGGGSASGGPLAHTDLDGVPELVATPWLTPSPFGPGATVTVSAPVDGDVGFVYTCIVAQFSDDFMNGLDRGCGGQARTPEAGTAAVPVVVDSVLPVGTGYWIVVLTSASQAAFESHSGTMYVSVGGSSTYFRQQWTAGVMNSSADTGVGIPTFASGGGTLPLAYTNGDGLAELAGTPSLGASSVTIGSDPSIVVSVPVDSDAGSVCVAVGQGWNLGNGEPPWQEQGTGCASFTSGTAHTRPVTVVFAGLTPGILSMTIFVGLETPGPNTNTSWNYASTKNPGLFRVVKYPGSPSGVESETGVPIPTFTAVAP